jgi:alpha-beta hydrolase superfamily lysophospholipase
MQLLVSLPYKLEYFLFSLLVYSMGGSLLLSALPQSIMACHMTATLLAAPIYYYTDYSTCTACEKTMSDRHVTTYSGFISYF